MHVTLEVWFTVAEESPLPPPEVATLKPVKTLIQCTELEEINNN